MISASAESLKNRAEHWQQQVGQGDVIPELSTVGGGSLPEETLPTYVLSLDIPRVDTFAVRLRRAEPPVIGRVQGGRLLLDPRTVLEGEDESVIHILKTILAGVNNEDRP